MIFGKVRNGSSLFLDCLLVCIFDRRGYSDVYVYVVNVYVYVVNVYVMW